MYNPAVPTLLELAFSTDKYCFSATGFDLTPVIH